MGKLFSLVALFNAALAAASVDYPQDSTIKPGKYSGSGCPIESNDRRTSVVDHMWAGVFYNDDRTDATWHYALNLPSTLGPAVFGTGSFPEEASRSCTHEWKFVNSTGYRLVAHKNGTEVIARYRLGKDKAAVFKITYYLPDGSETVDTITVNGPLGSPYSGGEFASAPEKAVSTNPSQSWTTGCSEEDHFVKIKTEVSIEGPGNPWGQVWGGYKDEFYNRILQTFTYSWEKCE